MVPWTPGNSLGSHYEALLLSAHELHAIRLAPSTWLEKRPLIALKVTSSASPLDRLRVIISGPKLKIPRIPS